MGISYVPVILFPHTPPRKPVGLPGSPYELVIIIKILDFLLFSLYFVTSNVLFIINESIDSKKYSRPVQKDRKLLERGKVPWGTESFPESVLN
jgi:hypothetical protein